MDEKLSDIDRALISDQDSNEADELAVLFVPCFVLAVIVLVGTYASNWLNKDEIRAELLQKRIQQYDLGAECVQSKTRLECHVLCTDLYGNHSSDACVDGVEGREPYKGE